MRDDDEVSEVAGVPSQEPSDGTGPHPAPAAADLSSWPMWVLALVVLVDQIDVSILRGVLEELRRDFGLSDGQLGILASSYVIVNALVAVPAGYLADRWVRTRTVGYAMFAWSGITALGAAAPNYGTLVALRGALGFGQAISEPASNSLMADYYPPSRRSRAFAIQQVCLVLGTAIGIALGGAVGVALGWRWAFLIVGSPSVLVAFLVLRLKEPRRGMGDRHHLGIDVSDEVAEESSPLFEGGFRAFLRDLVTGLRTDLKVIIAIPTMRYMLVGVATLMFTFAGVNTWLPSFYERQLEVAEGRAQALVGAMIFLAGVPGVLLGGWVGDRYGSRIKAGRIVIPAGCIMISSVFLTLAWIQTSIGPSFALTVIGFFPVAMALPIIRAGVSDAVPAHIRGTGFGAFQLTVVLLGYAMGPLVIGFLSGAFDDNLRTAFLIVMPMVLLGGVIFLQARRHFEADAARILEAIMAAVEADEAEKKETPGPGPTGGDTASG